MPVDCGSDTPARRSAVIVYNAVLIILDDWFSHFDTTYQYKNTRTDSHMVSQTVYILHYISHICMRHAVKSTESAVVKPKYRKLSRWNQWLCQNFSHKLATWPFMRTCIETVTENNPILESSSVSVETSRQWERYWWQISNCSISNRSF